LNGQQSCQFWTTITEYTMCATCCLTAIYQSVHAILTSLPIVPELTRSVIKTPGNIGLGSISSLPADLLFAARSTWRAGYVPFLNVQCVLLGAYVCRDATPRACGSCRSRWLDSSEGWVRACGIRRAWGVPTALGSLTGGRRRCSTTRPRVTLPTAAMALTRVLRVVYLTLAISSC